MKVAIVIPAYNEAPTIGTLLEELETVVAEHKDISWEIIVVDDGSTDTTAQEVKKYLQIKLLQQDNSGKGAAVRTGAAASLADWIVVQDGDLEYSPRDIPQMLETIRQNGATSIVFGSRTLRAGNSRFHLHRHSHQEFMPFLAGVALTITYAVTYGTWISDSLTGYKVYPLDRFLEFSVDTNGFETDHELTCKFIRSGHKIHEIPISYIPRSRSEGKKIRARDGFVAIMTIIRYRRWKRTV
jgi:dolichol-phosphate mannosyltransferase